jgi:prephenate dehydrogenase
MSLPRVTAILGLGLMGGSIARDLAARGALVLGHDAREDALAAAIAEGIVQGALDDRLEGLAAADLVVLATPVVDAVALLEQVAPRLAEGAVVTDLGSTKVAIARRATELGIGHRFVGSHPLTGDHRSGWAASRPGLYADVPVFLCPTPVSSPEARAKIAAFWAALGATLHEIEPEHHDYRMAWVSHLPQVASTSVAAALSTAGFGPADLGPGGRDVTRLAASSAEMWSAIALANADPLRHAVETLQARLATFLHALDQTDAEALRDFFQGGREWSA